MNKNKLHRAIHLYTCCCISFFVAFKFLLPVFIILLTLNWMMEGRFKEKFASLADKKTVLLFISLYFLYVIGMTYSKNLSYGWADLQTKFSLLLFPLLLSNFSFTQQELKKIMYSLLSGVVLASFILLMRAFYFYFTQHLNYFFYIDFSYWAHPSYFGMSVNLALLFLLVGKDLVFSPTTKLLLLLFLTLIIVLLSSKLALICTLILFFSYGCNRIIRSKKYKLGFAALLIFVSVIVLLFTQVPELESRIHNSIDALSADKIDITSSESNTVRILVWKAASQAFVESGPLGFGAGDVKDELFSRYAINGFTGALEHKLNAHNQFLQTGIALGWIGFLLLLLTIFLPVYNSWKQNNFLFVGFSVMIVINLLTESMLEAEAGVIFIAFFQSLLFFRSTTELP